MPCFECPFGNILVCTVTSRGRGHCSSCSQAQAWAFRDNPFTLLVRDSSAVGRHRTGAGRQFSLVWANSFLSDGFQLSPFPPKQGALLPLQLFVKDGDQPQGGPGERQVV